MFLSGFTGEFVDARENPWPERLRDADVCCGDPCADVEHESKMQHQDVKRDDVLDERYDLSGEFLAF
jgi:hypothetical protein